MELTFVVNGERYSASSSSYADISVAVAPYDPSTSQPETFHLPPAVAAPFTAGAFTASIDSGASINCPVVSSLCAHSNGTHTECVGHALPGRITLADIAPVPPFMPALLLTVDPVRLGDEAKGAGCSSHADLYRSGQADDRVVSASLLDLALEAVSSMPKSALLSFLQGGALIIRTLPNDVTKRSCKWSSTNPPYPLPDAVAWALERGVQHLVLDLPSTDREDDQGLLLTHRTFWGLPSKDILASSSSSSASSSGAAASSPLSHRTITELAYIPGHVADGAYMLSLQVAPIQLDAAPSRPLLFPVRRVD